MYDQPYAKLDVARVVRRTTPRCFTYSPVPRKRKTHRFDKTHGFEPCVLYAWFRFSYAWFFARMVFCTHRFVLCTHRFFFVRIVSCFVRMVLNYGMDTIRYTNKYLGYLFNNILVVYRFLVYSLWEECIKSRWSGLQ